MALVVSGLLNKQVGGELGISEITVKAHRGQVMRKMNAHSLAHLVTMAASLGINASGRADPGRALTEAGRQRSLPHASARSRGRVCPDRIERQSFNLQGRTGVPT